METLERKTQLRGIALCRQLIENKRISRQETEEALKDPNSDVSLAFSKLREMNAKKLQQLADV